MTSRCVGSDSSRLRRSIRIPPPHPALYGGRAAARSSPFENLHREANRLRVGPIARLRHDQPAALTADVARQSLFSQSPRSIAGCGLCRTRRHSATTQCCANEPADEALTPPPFSFSRRLSPESFLEATRPTDLPHSSERRRLASHHPSVRRNASWGPRSSGDHAAIDRTVAR
jgi:hypothetical protein